MNRTMRTMIVPMMLLALLLLTSCGVRGDDGGGGAFNWLLPTEGSANAFLARGGPTQVGVTLTWTLGTYSIGNVQGTAMLDGMYAGAEKGLGLSTEARVVAELLRMDEWLYPYLPVEFIVERLAIGTCILWDGDNERLNAGPYLRMMLAQTKF